MFIVIIASASGPTHTNRPTHMHECKARLFVTGERKQKHFLENEEKQQR